MVASLAEISQPALRRWHVKSSAGCRAQLDGKVNDGQMTKRLAKLQREVETRRRVIGEPTVADLMTKKSVPARRHA